MQQEFKDLESEAKCAVEKGLYLPVYKYYRGHNKDNQLTANIAAQFTVLLTHLLLNIGRWWDKKAEKG